MTLLHLPPITIHPLPVILWMGILAIFVSVARVVYIVHFKNR
jgi:hypothetical protein